MNARSVPAARIQPGHLRGDTTFVQVNQTFWRGLTDFLKELDAPLSVGFAVALLGVE